MPEPVSVKSLITPLDQTLRIVFGAARSYFIDIYQREYKWTVDNVKTLLNDIELRFAQHALRYTEPTEIQKDVLERFEPYFLNTYLTSTTSANTSIVDGQQRLTTLLLMLIKFYHILKDIEATPDAKGKTFSSKALEQLIFEMDDFGAAQRFKIFNENREAGFRALVKGTAIDKADQTTTRMAENFGVISQYYDGFLKGAQSGTVDLAKTTYYLTYLLDRISIVEIRVERPENVAMIFEVVNDRGMGLKPYEILKGKLIGNLPSDQKEKANSIWTDLQERYFKVQLKNTTETTIDLDTFFQTFFRAKFADSENDYERFEGNYHYEIYRNERVRKYFEDFRNRTLLFERITGDIKYYAELYLELRTTYAYEPLIFNKLLDQNQQYLIIMSAMLRNDPDRVNKIEGIATKFDQFHSVLRLLDAYDSNSFQRLVYDLNKEVRDEPLAEIRPILEQTLIKGLVNEEVLQKDQCGKASEIFEFERFKGIHNRWTNFSKYVLMRIDRYLAQLLDKPSYTLEPLVELEDRFNKNNLKRHGMHLEHILTQHPANHALFTDEKGVFNEAPFNQTRNYLGMVLLLTDKQNLSSNNEIYQNKLETYSKSNLIWNELLVGDLANVHMKNVPSDLQFLPIQPNKGVFPLDQVENRQRAIFAAIRHLWANV